MIDSRIEKVKEYKSILLETRKKFIVLNYDGHLYVLLNRQAEPKDHCLCIGELIDNLNSEIENGDSLPQIDPFAIFQEENTCKSCRKIVYTTNFKIQEVNG